MWVQPLIRAFSIVQDRLGRWGTDSTRLPIGELYRGMKKRSNRSGNSRPGLAAMARIADASADRELTLTCAPGMLPATGAVAIMETRLQVNNTEDAVAFVHKVNRDRAIQEQVSALKPRDWANFFALAAELGYEIDLETLYYGCLSDKVVHFCPALVRFAGQLYSYKM